MVNVVYCESWIYQIFVRKNIAKFDRNKKLQIAIHHANVFLWCFFNIKPCILNFKGIFLTISFLVKKIQASWFNTMFLNFLCVGNTENKIGLLWNKFSSVKCKSVNASTKIAISYKALHKKMTIWIRIAE